ncbi:hypothetical protein BU24DRAFT_184498 [Aaosphaeria arxii CBS 175.79]|uniref:Mid2 domain-containing protein n=1 Tax=Aaosphaeria arxii CBS 175.79 TaxID=1450172 RepID=A0A6A5XR23_9PLEO|nr:uncharacterized protein BU24DRAFT_184498 [Aaosphaeria arxii CBS 175.79]KAF2015745.1 hypothetical protein BU24DRAFT_184498 [Aaosphaeria arxii CBS 175.79]
MRFSSTNKSLMGVSSISLLLLATTTFPLIQAASIFPRQAETCGGNKELSQCGNAFPSDFCCPANTECKSLNVKDGISAICCPKGQDCSFLLPITCDITALNATLHPDNQVHLANSSAVELPKCGSKCCPLGYSCKGDMCSADNGSTPPSGTPTGSPTPSSTDTSSVSQTATAEFPPVVKVEQGFNAKSFAAGFFPGIILGVLATLGIMWLIKKRRDLNEKNRYSGDFGHVARTISDPIYDPARAARVDFIRRGSHSAQNSPNSTTGFMNNRNNNKPTGGGLTPRIKSMWERTPRLGALGFSSSSSAFPSNGLPANPAPPAPAIRAGDHRDPYRTPRQTPRQATSSRSRATSIGTASINNHARRPSISQHENRPFVARSESQETIDILMPSNSDSLLRPPKAPGMRENNRWTQDSNTTTVTKLMESVGYGEADREKVRNFQATPGQAR